MFRFRIKALRKEKGYSQSELAKIIGISQSAVASWESGVRIPTSDTLQQLAEFFEVSVDYLLGRSGDRDIRPLAADGQDTFVAIGRNGKVVKMELTDEKMKILLSIIDALNNDNDPQL
ncbi:MAG: helix-turn-helix domain-containing protein [Oscillospiraceae bacterium]|jgi:transcriptional regulator with XRE-family HTH domain|nr:helix-turn-helix domain-containing protein [Oscillospiraceae bacterium]